jgi:hypothetical protein
METLKLLVWTVAVLVPAVVSFWHYFISPTVGDVAAEVLLGWVALYLVGAYLLGFRIENLLRESVQELSKL